MPLAVWAGKAWPYGTSQKTNQQTHCFTLQVYGRKVMFGKFLSLSIAALVAYSASYACAQSADTLSRTIDEVTVSVSRTSGGSAASQIVERNILKNIPSGSVADAMRLFSGVSIRDYGGAGGLKTVNVRSLGSQHVGISLDGVQMGNVQNGVVDLGRLSLDNVESIQLSNAQSDAMLQSAKDYASASSVSLITRRPFFRPESGRTDNMEVLLRYGSCNTFNPVLRWEHLFDSGVTSALNADWLKTDGNYRFTLDGAGGRDTTLVRRNGDMESLRLEYTLFGDSTVRQWTAKVYAYGSGRGFPGAVVRGHPGVVTNQDRQDDADIIVQGTYQHYVSELYSFKVRAKYGYDYLHYRSDPEMATSVLYVDDVYRQQEAYASMSNFFDVNRWLGLSLVCDAQFNHLESDRTEVSSPSRLTLLTAASATLLWKGFRCRTSVLHTGVLDRAADGTSANRSLFTPAVLLSWSPEGAGNLSVRTFYKRIFRMPAFNDLYYTTVGNRNLLPEYTTQYDAGVTWSVPLSGMCGAYAEIQADVYYNEVENKIVAMPSGSQFRWTMMNYGQVRIAGADIVAQGGCSMGRSIHNVRLAYTYQKASDVTDVRSRWYGGLIPYAPLHSGSFCYSGSLREWRWSFGMNYAGKSFVSTANISENLMPARCIHDVVVSRTIRFDRFGMETSVELNNIFNSHYEVVQCYPMPGFNWKIKLQINI